MHMRIDIPSDKYLLSYMRVKIIDKEDGDVRNCKQTERQTLIN